MQAGGRLSLALCLLASLLAFACGKTGPPLPPPSLAPAPSHDLAVRQRGDTVVLDLAYPKTTVSGLAVSGLGGVEVWEMTRPAPETPELPDPREFAAAAKQRQRVPAGDLAAATVGDRLAITLPLEPLGEEPPQLIFAVRTVATNGQRSALSNLAAIEPVAPPAAPTELAARPGPDGIEITWSEATGAGAEPTGFRIYRRPSDERTYGLPLRTIGGDAHRLVDGSAEFGRRYIYTVTALAGTTSPVESARAEEVEVDYEDRFPPPAPQGLVALAQANRVRLLWEASGASDVAGYRIERRAGGGEFLTLTPVPVTDLQYVDTTVEAGASYAYRVIAVDQRGNESAPSEIAEASPQ